MKKQILIGGLALFLAACQHDYYDKGDSELSYLHADFVEATTNSSAAFAKVITDNGTQLQLSPTISAKWATTPDSTYRSLLYYNKVENGITEPVAISNVLVLNPKDRAKVQNVTIDPLTLESAWVSQNNKYINLSLIVKTGVADDPKAAQTVGLVTDAVTPQAAGRNVTHHLTLLHSQNGIPEYYSTKAYVSIPTHFLTTGDSVYITINTYKGQVLRKFIR